MKESIYIHATKKAWHFTWEHKTLWFFGSFAAFLGQFGIMEFLGKVGIQKGNSGYYLGTFGSVLSQVGNFVANAGNSYDSKIILFFLLTLILCIFSIFIFVSVVSQGLLLYAESQEIKNKKINIVKSWHVGTANFWRLFFLNFFKKIIIAIMAITVSLSAYGALLSPSIQKAWQMFVGHPVVSFEIGLLILIFNMFFGVIVALGFILLVLPAVLIWFAVVLAGGTQIAISATFVASVIMFTMYILVAGASFTVFTTYIWTYTFVEMHGKGIKSVLVNFFRRLRGKK